MNAQLGPKLKKQLILFAPILFLIFWPAILAEIFPQAGKDTFPSHADLAPGILSIVLISRLRCPYSKLFGYIWISWFFIGNLNTIASSIVLGSYYRNLELQDASQIYLWGCNFYLAGLLLFENIFNNNRNAIYSVRAIKSNLHPLIGIMLLAFPIAWLASLYKTLGYIPILQGASIVDDMYNMGYGPLYPYSSCIIISIIYAAYRAMTERSFAKRCAYTLLAVAFVIISTADGKRVLAMAAIGGVIGISFRILQEKTWTRILPAICSAVLFLYVGVLLLRVGDDGGMTSNTYSRLMIVGVEFRDFVYTVNHYKPGEIPDYSWLISSLASMTNGFVLNLMGYDKAYLTSLDSARAWSQIFNINFGIRTGIISELWFAYGLASMGYLVIFGFLTGTCTKLLRSVHGVRGLLIFAAVFGMILLAITGQSTSTLGVLPVFLYLYIAIRLAELVLRRKRLKFNTRN